MSIQIKCKGGVRCTIRGYPNRQKRRFSTVLAVNVNVKDRDIVIALMDVARTLSQTVLVCVLYGLDAVHRRHAIRGLFVILVTVSAFLDTCTQNAR